MIFTVGDDQLAYALVRNIVSGAKFIEHWHAAYAVKSFKRPRLVVDPGVDDPAVAGRSAQAQSRRRFNQKHVVIVTGDFGGDSRSGNSAADDNYIYRFEKKPPLIGVQALPPNSLRFSKLFRNFIHQPVPL